MADAYLRFPHVQGRSVTFVAEDDVWLASVDGGRAWRLSADRVPVSHPRFSPDGTTVAWTSTRDGAPEVYAAPAAGGDSRRLTYWGAAKTRVCGWTRAGEVIALSEAGQASDRRTWAHAVPLTGGQPRLLPYGVVGDLAFGPGGQVLVTTPSAPDPARWKRYRGGTASKLWLDPTGGGDFDRLLPDHLAPLVWPMWVADRIVVVTDHEGVGDLYTLDDGLQRLTSHDFYVRNASTDGSRVVYQVAGELWLLDEPGAEGSAPRRVDISLGSARPGRQPRYVDADEDLGTVAPDQTARASAIEARGTVHWVTHRDGPVRALAAQPGVRARLPVIVGTDRVAWVTDAEGEDAIELAPTAGVDPGAGPRRLAAGRLGRVLELAAAPDGSTLAAASHDGRLLLVDVATGAVREVVRADNGEVNGLAFSPDSAWLAWSHPRMRRMGGDMEGLRQIRLTRVDDLRVVDVTAERFSDFAPVFTQDGRHLAFLSIRSFDPSYDAYVFDLSFPNGCRPHLVPLAATTPSPFDAELDGRAPDETSDSGRPPAVEPTVVDVEGLDQRVRPFPVPAARYRGLRAVRDGVVWLRQPLSGELGDDRPSLDDEWPRSALERYDLARRRLDVLADPVDEVYVSGDGARLVVEDSGTLRVVPARRSDGSGSDEGPDAEFEIDLARVRIRVDPGSEWLQSFDEAGRLMRDNYWRADMGGLDWAATLARYRPVVDRVGGHDDLVDLLWEVQGELGTSHAYVLPPPTGHSGRGQGLLGADLRRDDDGVWRIARILPGESSDPRARSPLLAPGVGAHEGDAVLAVDGRPVAADDGPAPLLVRAAGMPVELTIGADDGVRRVVVTPLADETPLRYQDWVAGRRAYVHEQSGGRLGYLHVPDMMSPGWAQLHRDLRLELARDGVVVDLRENGGGHTSQLVVEKLARRVLGWSLTRGMQPESYPLDARRGPMVAVIDEWAGSDGDIVSAAIRALGLGPLVGTRTWGGVIGIDMKYRLVDGTVVTQPRYSFWLEGPGWGVENHGVDPDVEVVMRPQDHVAGRDPQLDTAIRLALESLESHAPASPPDLPPLAR